MCVCVCVQASEDGVITTTSLPAMLRAVNKARLQLREQTLQQQAWAEISLKLALDMHEIAGREDAARATIATDIARAVGGSAAQVTVRTLRAGSILAQVYLFQDSLQTLFRLY